MMRDIFVAFWFFLPAGAANVAPILAARVPAFKRLAVPVDGGHSLGGIRVLGDNKTWRGFAAGIVAATVVLWLQQLLAADVGWLHGLTSQIDYAHLPTLLVGPLFGVGALGGDATESFLKRRQGIPPGHAWFPFDQTDYIIGGAIATAPFVTLSMWQYVWLLAVWTIAHLLASYGGWLMGLKDKPL